MSSMYKMGRTVGEFTKRYRETNSLTQGDLAHKLGVHAQYVSNIERGTHKGAIAFAKSFSKIIKDKKLTTHLYNLAIDEKIDGLVDRMEKKDD